MGNQGISKFMVPVNYNWHSPFILNFDRKDFEKPKDLLLQD